MKILNSLSKENLQWYPEVGIGYYPVKVLPYDAAYFQKYVEMEQTEIGKKLNQARISLVQQFTMMPLIDIGIGSGAFVKGLRGSHQICFGYDINPCAVEWLKERDFYKSPFSKPFKNATFWDSLEHIHKPKAILDNVQDYVFVSCPIYKDSEHILRSKHFRKDEHCWYWSVAGIENFMHNFGFKLISLNTMESDLGREDIWSFVFERQK